MKRKVLGDIQISHEDMKTVIRRHYEKKEPANFTGATGIGKSQIILEEGREIAKNLKCDFYEWNALQNEQKIELLTMPNPGKIFVFADIRLSQKDTSDLIGLPNINNTEYMQWIPPLLFKVLSRPGINGIIFFDEANLSCPAVQASMYQILNENQCGELPLSKNTVCFMAGNRLDDNAHVMHEADPLKNRRANYELRTPTADEWIDNFAIKHKLDARIMGFLKQRQSYIHKQDSNRASQSFASPRTWHKTSNLIMGIEAKGTDPNKDSNLALIETLSYGEVGPGVANEFISFIHTTTKLDLDKILKNPVLAKKIVEPDEKYALVTGIAEKYRAKPDLVKPALQVCALLKPEFGLFMLKLMKTFAGDEKFANQISNDKTWQNQLSTQYQQYLE